MAVTHDRKIKGFQAVALVLALGLAAVHGEEKANAPSAEAAAPEKSEVLELETIAPRPQVEDGPVRMGDPEVIWDAPPKEEPLPKPGPVSSPAAPKVGPTGKSAEETVQALLASVHPGDAYPEQYRQMLDLGESAVPTLVQVLNDPSSVWQTRWFAAMALGRIGGASAKGSLEAAAEDPLFLIRLAAVQALGILREVSSAAVVRKALSDKAMVVRASAADTTGLLRDPEALPLLQKELFEPRNFYRGRSLWVRAHIVDALVKIGSEASVPALVRLLKDQDAGLRSKACDALERLVSKPPAPADAASSCEKRWLSWYQRPR
ncbi:MAG: HEAT repeat domain-containing protein [Pseudomonadota bacterium]